MKASRRNIARAANRADGPPQISKYAAKRGVGVPREPGNANLGEMLAAHFNKEPDQ